MPTMKAWLKNNMPAGSKIGIDADIHSISEVKQKGSPPPPPPLE